MYLLTRWNSNEFIFQLDTKVCASSLSIYLIHGKKKFLPTLINGLWYLAGHVEPISPSLQWERFVFLKHPTERVPPPHQNIRAKWYITQLPSCYRFITILFKVSVAMLHTWTLYETEWRVRELKPSEVQNLNNNKILFKNAIYGFLLGI